FCALTNFTRAVAEQGAVVFLNFGSQAAGHQCPFITLRLKALLATLEGFEVVRLDKGCGGVGDVYEPNQVVRNHGGRPGEADRTSVDFGEVYGRRLAHAYRRRRDENVERREERQAVSTILQDLLGTVLAVGVYQHRAVFIPRSARLFLVE